MSTQTSRKQTRKNKQSTCEDVVVAGVVTQHVSEEDASHRNDVVGVFGRPKGSTQAHSRKLKERFEASNRMGRWGI